MTGEEFLNKVRGIKSITDIHWHFEGEDLTDLEPDSVKVVVKADNETFELLYPLVDEGIQFAAIAILINKFMELTGNDYRTTAHKDLAKAINYSRELL